MGYRKLGRTSDQRKAMLRDLATSLIVSERIETTEARAKEIRKTVEKMITLGSEIVGDTLAKNVVKGFVNGHYDGGRHQIRVDMLNKMC